MLAVPQILIAVGIVAACSTSKDGCLGGLIQPGLPLVIVVIALFSWPYIARIVRGYTLSLREKEFVEASRAAGAEQHRGSSAARSSRTSIGPLIVYTTLLIPHEHPLRGRALVPRPRRPAGRGVLGRDPQRRLSSSTTSPGG